MFKRYLPIILCIIFAIVTLVMLTVPTSAESDPASAGNSAVSVSEHTCRSAKRADSKLYWYRYSDVPVYAVGMYD